RGSVSRSVAKLRRPAPWVSRDSRAICTPNAGAPRGYGQRRLRASRICADPLDTRTAHPPGESDIEHLHEPVSVRPDGDGLSCDDGAQRAARNRGAEYFENGLRGLADSGTNETSRPVPCCEIQ